jgi:predicted GNAT superfamily acetyltransferase
MSVKTFEREVKKLSSEFTNLIEKYASFIFISTL